MVTERATKNCKAFSKKKLVSKAVAAKIGTRPSRAISYKMGKRCTDMHCFLSKRKDCKPIIIWSTMLMRICAMQV